MNKIFITNNPDIAMHSIESGVDIIMVDLETIGKKKDKKNSIQLSQIINLMI